MGRELQKKKNRSSIPRVRQRTKSKKLNIRGSTIVAANWDSRQTLSQNYKRLGLSSRLNTASGGAEKHTVEPTELRKVDPLSIIPQVPKKLIPGEVRVERDSAGNIVKVIRDTSHEDNPLGDPLTELLNSQPSNEVKPAATEVVAKLEEQARNSAPKQVKKQSNRETEWLDKLVEKHGDNYFRMTMDRRLNPMQLSEGDLKSRIRRRKGLNS